MPADQAQQFDFIGVKGVIGFFFQEMEALSGRLWLDLVCNRFDSTQATETYAGLGLAPQLREWLGGKQPNSFNEASVKITNKDWESTIRIKNKDMRRDKTGQVRMKMGEMAERAMAHDALLVSALLNDSETGSLAKAFDGRALYSASHTFGASGTINNILSVTIANVPIGDSGWHGSTTVPSIGEMAYCIMQGIQTMYGFKDDQGEPLNEFASEFVVMVPPSLATIAEAAINSAYISLGQTNPLQFGKGPNQKALSISVRQNPRLTWTTQFAIFRTDCVAKTFIIQLENGPVMKALGEGSDNEFINNEHLFSVEKSGNVGVGRFDRTILVKMV